MKNFTRFSAILFTAITLSALLAHLFEMPVKLKLSLDDYQLTQSLYSGWHWLGIFEIGALLLTMVWTIRDRNRNIFRFLLTAFLCLGTSLTVFFMFTFPANQATVNWTEMPADWQDWRKRWEYSHALRALLYLFAFSFLIISLLLKRGGRTTE